jgi:hypothetical protein
MKKNLFVALIFVVGLAVFGKTVSAQFPISIPKIPKIKKERIEQPKAEEVKEEEGGNTPTDVKTNPAAAQSDYDANLKPGDQAIAVDDFSSVNPVKILAKSGNAYKVLELNYSNHTYWYNANSVYPFFNNDDFEKIMVYNQQYLEPYLDCYAKKHNLDIHNVADASHSDGIYGGTEKMRKALQADFPKLIEIESQLKSQLQSRPDTFLNFRHNPAIWEEIITNRNQYLECAVGLVDAKPDPFLNAFLNEIGNIQKEVEQYTPETRIALIGKGDYGWLQRAVSKKMREEWLSQWTKNPAQRQQFNEALDTLSAVLARKLPLYTPNPKYYTFRSPAEEAMMKGALKAPATSKIYRIGLNQANWLIDKNGLDIPTARFKRGMIWLKYQGADHPYCYMAYVNIIQDYAGGGTYGASYAKFIEQELAGCPAGT